MRDIIYTITGQETLIEELIEIEMNPCCHSDNADEYSNDLEYYLSNVIKQDYINYLCNNYDVETKEAEELQEHVIFEIKHRMRLLEEVIPGTVATERWNLERSTIRKSKRFLPHERRIIGRNTTVTIHAMRRIFGPEPGGEKNG
ncbi:helix-turn-helix domain-containing protein [Vallitalea guaymasensis]|uniref:helix-turn-helix domain-containing protein n=1 Tax=Vallitalea guaymasensis TaxID=1185412 RepID=UPI000DE35541|nr:helix-turn-helix domain-containing protein [Vallitalea guaymasensis]